MNRSIQAEGSFGEIKQDMQFRRYLTKGTINVLAESTLLAIARNINKLHNKIQNGKTGLRLNNFHMLKRQPRRSSNFVWRQGTRKRADARAGHQTSFGDNI